MQPPAATPAVVHDQDRSRSRLILLGASVRAAAQSAQRAGIGVLGLDLFGDTDTVAACRQHYSITALSQPDLRSLVESLPRSRLMQVGGLSRTVDLSQVIGEKHQWLGTPLAVQTRLGDPATLAQLAASAGMRFPETSTSPLPSRSLRKSTDSCGGLDVRWSTESLEPTQPPPEGTYPSGDETRSAGTFFQRWIAGRCYGTTFLADGTRAHLLGVCRSMFTRQPELPFVYCGSIGPVALSPAVMKVMVRLGNALIDRGVQGLFGVDWILDRQERCWLLEVNPRWTGSCELIERILEQHGHLTSGQSLLDLAVQSCQGQPISVAGTLADAVADKPQPPEAYLKRIVYARRKMRFRQTLAQRVLAPLSDSRLSLQIADVPADGAVVDRCEPILTLLARVNLSPGSRPIAQRIAGCVRQLAQMGEPT